VAMNRARRIDAWIGRHMNAKRWVRVWVLVALVGVAALGSAVVWWRWCGAAMMFLSAFMFDGNLRRLR